MEWLAQLPDLDPQARPERVVVEHGYERWEGNGALGYLVLARSVEAQLFDLPRRSRLVVASHCFPTGAFGERIGVLITITPSERTRRIVSLPATATESLFAIGASITSASESLSPEQAAARAARLRAFPRAPGRPGLAQPAFAG